MTEYDHNADILADTEGYERVNHHVTITSPKPCKKLWTFTNWNKYHHILTLQSSCFAKFDDVTLRFYLRANTRDINDPQWHTTTIKFYSMWAELVEGKTDQAFSAVILVPRMDEYGNERKGTSKYDLSYAFTPEKKNVLVQQDLIFMESKYMDGKSTRTSFAGNPHRYWRCCKREEMIIKIEVCKCSVLDEKREVPLSEKRTSSFSEQIASLLENVEDQKHSDVTLRMGDNQCLKAHKAILSARSTVFRAMFDSEMKEAVNSIVEISDISSDAMKVVLKFVYSDKIGTNWIRCPDDVVRAANKYDLPVLQQYVNIHLISCVTNDNAIKLFKMAKLYNLETAKMQLLEYINNNPAAVLVGLELGD